jgi:hypothetical protein
MTYVINFQVINFQVINFQVINFQGSILLRIARFHIHLYEGFTFWEIRLGLQLRFSFAFSAPGVSI